MKLKLITLLIVVCGSALTVSAQGSVQGKVVPPSVASVISAYQSYKTVGAVAGIKVPTVVEVPIADEFIERLDFAVLDTTMTRFEPHYFRHEVFTTEVPFSATTNMVGSYALKNDGALNDGDVLTYADFPLPEVGQGGVQIILSSKVPVTSSALTTLLDKNVALPNTVEIRALVGGQDRIVVATRRMEQNTILFPQTVSNRWTITFAFSQPLRIGELKLRQDNASNSSVRAVRFLAQPGHDYRIYLNSDRYAPAPVGEAGNLRSAENVKVLSAKPSQSNPNYSPADVDADGVPDRVDNCVYVANVDQKDVDGNERGDVCDDFDQDRLLNSKDNCPNDPNLNQQDTDGDGIGDVCDGQESRVTERYAWIPWAGIGFATLVLAGLFILTAKSTFGKKQE
jgi:hypothetical protein